jgi:drug/metabolite transporter (DMT)-like permease
MIWLCIASLLWAFSFGLIKHHLAGLDPWWVAVVRLALAAVVFLPWTVVAAPPETRLRWRALVLGMLQFGAMYTFFLAAFGSLAAWQVALWTVLTPIYVALLASWRARRTGLRPLAAAVLAVLGALLAEGRLPQGSSLDGVLLVQASNLCFAAGQLGYGPLLARVRERSPAASGGSRRHELGLLGWMYLGATVLVVAGLAASGGRLVPPATQLAGGALPVLIYLGLVPTAVGFWVWNKGAARTAAGPLAVANNLKVPLGVIVAWSVFGEAAPYLRAAAGLAVIAAALALARPRRGVPTVVPTPCSTRDHRDTSASQ